MRREDPKRVATREKRDSARLWLDILCCGIGRCLQNGESHYPEGLRAIIGRVNGELLDAVAASEVADKAYEPYWAGRRRRVSVMPRKRKKVA